jgi:hypothetical protein
MAGCEGGFFRGHAVVVTYSRVNEELIQIKLGENCAHFHDAIYHPVFFRASYSRPQ